MNCLRRIAHKLMPPRKETSAVGMTVVLAGAVGVATGLLVLLTDGAIELLHRHVFGKAAVLAALLPPRLSLLGTLAPTIMLAAVLVAVAWMLRRWAPEAGGPGIGDVMDAAGRRGGFIRSRVILLKPLATALCIGAGAPLGLEGPVVQTGAAVGSLAGRRFHLGVLHIRILVAAGAAAGLAVKYGAPIGGAVFSAELILGSAGPVALLPLIVASFLGVMTRHGVIGNVAEFDIVVDTSFGAIDYAMFMLLGLAAGILATYFIKAIVFSDELAHRLFRSWWARALFCGLGVGLLCTLRPELFGTGKEVVQQLLRDPDYSVALLLVLLFMKPLLCATSLAGGASGGVFAPSLVAGAALGGLFARFVGNALGLDLTASAYVMAGMAAVMGAVMRAPLQAILVTFELTHNYAVIPPLMITCVLALKVSELFEPDSAFTWQLARAGRKLRGGLDFSLLNGLTVADLMDDEFVALPEHAPITELGALIRASENRTFPVLGEDGKLRGIVMLANLMAAASRARASGRAPAVEDLLEPESVWLEPATPLLSAWETMGNYDYDCLPVCRKEHDGLTLLGICEREAILEMHDRQAFVALTAGSSG